MLKAIPITQILESTTATKDQVKKPEIKVAAFIVEHSLPFQIMGHLSDLVKTFPHSKITLEFARKNTKTRSFVKHVIERRFRCEIEDILHKVSSH